MTDDTTPETNPLPDLQDQEPTDGGSHGILNNIKVGGLNKVVITTDLVPYRRMPTTGYLVGLALEKN